MKNIYSFSLFFIFAFSLAAQPNIQWQKSLGGSADEIIRSVKVTSDGGYVIAGQTNSNDGDFSGNHGGTDIWVVKLTKDGNVQWQKTLGGSDLEIATAIQPTTDGGYILVGSTESKNGDVTENKGRADVWIVKLNSTGDLQWQKTFGGSEGDVAYSVQQTNDGGYILAGSTESNDGDVADNHGSGDYWILKLSETGSIQWQQTLGGSKSDIAYSILQTSDGGYMVAGGAWSNDGDVTGSKGGRDYWLIKLADSGSVQWKKSFGGSSDEAVFSIRQTSDGGFVLMGYSISTNGDINFPHGALDYWFLKLSSEGDIQLKKALGGTNVDFGRDVLETSDGKFILAGVSISNNGNVSGNHGNDDFWVVKMGSGGSLQWQKSLGGSKDDMAYAIEETNDGGFILAGYTKSNDGDVTGNHGGWDGWLVKLASESVGVTDLLSKPMGALKIFPNPAIHSISLKIESEESTMTVNISDLAGRQISHHTILNGGTMDVSSLPNGNYTLIATTPLGKVYSGRVNVQK